MTDKDDVLLRKFFTEQKQTIADDGFSRKVMRRLPSKAIRYSRIWSTICIVAILLVFVTCHGFKQILNILDALVRTVPTHNIFDYSPFTIAIIVVVLAGLGLYNLVMEEK